MDFAAKYDRRSPDPLEITRDELAAMAGGISPAALIHATPLTGGFSSDNLLLEFADGERCVLRLSANKEKLRKEADLLTFVKERAPTVPVPSVIWRAGDSAQMPAFAMDFVDGVNLAEAEDGFSEAEARSVSEQLGRAAAAIHAITFAHSGLIGPGPSIAEPFSSYGDGVLGFLSECLEDALLQRRVGPERLGRLEQSLELAAQIVEPSATGQLCHGDFNQKNMIVIAEADPVQITGILDWEFAMSGSGVMDIGNLLRFQDESRAADAARFIDAYREAGGYLDNDWRAQSLFADLLAQCAFLTGIDERPNTFRTAIGVIDRTLTDLGL